MERIRITMLIAEIGLTGTPRMMMDIIENIDLSKFEVSVAFKPDYSMSDEKLLLELLKKEIKLVPLKGRTLFSFMGIRDLYKHLQRDRIQIIHCWDALRIVARIIKIVSGCKVVESYCNPVISKGSWKYEYVNKMTSLFIDGIIFCTPGVESSYTNNRVLFLRASKIALIANCIDTSVFNKNEYDQMKIREKWGIDETTNVLTNTGNFNEQKGQEYLIQALNLISAEVFNIKLILVGWGPRESIIKQEVDNYNIEKNVIFAGKCSREETAEILAISHIFVLSSLWEGFGLVIGEAMAMGVPVICTQTDGSDIVVKQGETGIVVPQNDIKSFAEAVVYLLTNSELMREMGYKGRRRVTELFSPERYIQEHEDFYNEILQ